jgi:hypothetical protein
MKIVENEYKDILESCRNPNDYNFISLQGGKYKLTRNWFKKVYLQFKDKFENGSSGSLVFSPRPQDSPLFIDIDLRLKLLPTGVDVVACYRGLIEMILGIFSEHFGGDDFVRVIATRRPEIYQKKNIFRGGFHLYVFGSYSLKTSQKLREHVLSSVDVRGHFEQIFGKDNMDLEQNASEDIYDIALSDRRNGCLLIGSNKPNISARPHFVFLHGRWRNGWEDEPETYEDPVWHLRDENKREEYNNALIELYSFIWEKSHTPVVSQEDEKVPEIEEVCDTPSKFNLKAFLEATKGYIPPNPEYAQLCPYFASQGLEPKATCDICNKYWGYNNRETERYMQKAIDNNDFRVTARTIRTYVATHCAKNVDKQAIMREIFGEDVEVEEMFFNELEKFEISKGKSWDLYEVTQTLKNVFSWVWGKSVGSFVYKEWYLHTHFKGEPFKQTNVCVVNEAPFKKAKNDMKVLINPTVDKLLELIEKWIKPKAPTLRKSTTEEQRTEFNEKNTYYKKELAKFKAGKKLLQQKNVTIKQIAEVMEIPDPKKVTMNKIFMDLHGDRVLKKYHSFTFIPYLEKNPCRADQLNCFTGFALSQFRNTDIDVRETAIWHWLWVTWCWKNQYKMDYILNYFATKLQKAHQKIKKFIVVYGNKTGSGKSTGRTFLERIFDECVLFCDSIDDFTGTYTSQQFGKLFCLVDDIQKWNKKTSAALKSRITSDTFRMRKMYSDPITMPSYLDLIATANSRTPVFIGSDDRRTELIEVNPTLKGDTAFWNQVYTEFDDKKIMGAWFEFLATRDLSQVPKFDENYRFSPEELALQKLTSLISAYSFLIDYFSREDFCFYKNVQFEKPDIFKHMMFKTIKDERTITIKKELLYEFYLRWVKLTGEVNKRKQNNFYRDLEDIDIKTGKYVFVPKENKLTGIRLSVKILQRGLGKHLSIEPGKIEVPWQIETEQWLELEKNSFPLRHCGYQFD